MKIARLLILSTALLWVMGCATRTDATMLSTGQVRPPVPMDQVVVYRTADQVPGKYEEIALLHSTGDTRFAEARLYQSMKKKAGSLGANGIILDAVSEPGAGAKVAAAIFGMGAERKGKALAIYVHPPGQ